MSRQLDDEILPSGVCGVKSSFFVGAGVNVAAEVDIEIYMVSRFLLRAFVYLKFTVLLYYRFLIRRR